MSTVDVISMLNRLIVTSKNGESALRSAAEEAHHADLQRALTEFSQFFGHAAHSLQVAVRELGGQPKALGTFDNTLHRTWMHLKATALGRDEAVILDAVERDEALGEDMFAEAVAWDTPLDVHSLLMRLHDGVRRHHRQIRDMREHLAELA
jgi:uncharacterized protein (TIGR02284 family)